MRIRTLILSTLVVGSSLYSLEDIYDNSIEDILSMESEIKVDIGSRDGARNYLESNTPIDVITSKQIDNSGLTSLIDLLRYFVPGFNAPETSVADGSDHVRAYSIRGMSPDQLLVLINGKRVHTSALLHVNGVIGRGSNHVDLDTIAIRSIERVEIMRDGASAQYGSDAISGVINIILKGMGHKNSIAAQYGKRSSGDGSKIQADAFVSLPLDYDGFVNLTMDATAQEATQRAGTDNRLPVPRVETHVGIPESQSYKAMLNAEFFQGGDVSVYANGLFNHRDSTASAFYRVPNSDSSNPDGFLPQINAKILDYSLTAGLKGKLSDETSWDLSNTYGVSDFHYYVNDSMNYTLGATSPSSFDNGALCFTQNTTNLDFKKSTNTLRIAGGLEYRYEEYKITAGDAASYTNNGDLTKVAGSQGFAGFTPDNEVDKNRNSFALYIDSIIGLSEKLSVEVLARYEEYSDFGESTNAKLAFAYKLTPELLLRVSGSTGFRAPSLAQSNYSQSSSFVNSSGILVSQGTFKTNHEISQALGATELRSERSKNASIGGVYQPTKNLSLMVDMFYIEVNDRILLTNDISGDTQVEKDLLASYGVSEARYFTNAANTQTQGIDIKIDYRYILNHSSKLDFNIWFNYTDNKLNNDSAETQNDVERIRIEDGQPKDSLRLLTNYEHKEWNVALNISRYGSYSQMVDSAIYNFDPAILADLDISYRVSKKFKVALGGTNIFDTLPNKWNGLNGDFYGENGIKPYSRYSPFGYSGAYYYLRASMEF